MICRSIYVTIKSNQLLFNILFKLIMAPLHRSISFQISEAFNGMLNKKLMKGKHAYYIDNALEPQINQCWHQKVLLKSLSYDFQINGKLQSSYNIINRTTSLSRRFGEINYNVRFYRINFFQCEYVFSFVYKFSCGSIILLLLWDHYCGFL